MTTQFPMSLSYRSVTLQAYTLGGADTQEPLLTPSESLVWMTYLVEDLNTRIFLK